MYFSDQPQKKKKKSFGEVDIKQEIKSEPEDHEAGKNNITKKSLLHCHHEITVSSTVAHLRRRRIMTNRLQSQVNTDLRSHRRRITIVIGGQLH